MFDKIQEKFCQFTTRPIGFRFVTSRVCCDCLKPSYSPMFGGLISTAITGTWWCHQMETFSALLAICVGNSPVPGEFPTQRPVTRSFDVYFDLCPNKRLSKQSWGWWLETPAWPLWRHSDENRNDHFVLLPLLRQTLVDKGDGIICFKEIIQI